MMRGSGTEKWGWHTPYCPNPPTEVLVKSPISDAKPDRLLARLAFQVRTFLHSRMGIDRPVAYTVIGRVWASVARLVTVLLIARFLSPAAQGYYYTFGSLVALQIVFELGFSFVILQMASHERAHLTIMSDGTIGGDSVAHARLASVLQKTVRWYAVAAALLVSFLAAAGTYFFSTHPQSGTDVNWRIPWYVAVVVTAITFQIDPVMSFMEGCGYVADVAKVRLLQSVAGSGLAWVVLVAHHGLFAPAVVIAGNAGVSMWWLFGKRRLLMGLFRYEAGMHRIHWFREVWPFQWRIAVSWACGYLIFQIFNPVLFAYRGAVAAGQMGMSLNIANGLQGLAIAWLNTKAAPFGSMVARREYFQLDQVFFRSLWQAILVCVSGAVCIVLAVQWLNVEHARFAERLLSPWQLALLMGSVVINIVVFAEALYLRAHKQEKFLLNSVLGAAAITLFTIFLGKLYGSAGMVMGCLATGLFMGLPLGTWTFLKYRRIWHAN